MEGASTVGARLIRLLRKSIFKLVVVAILASADESSLIPGGSLNRRETGSTGGSESQKGLAVRRQPLFCGPVVRRPSIFGAMPIRTSADMRTNRHRASNGFLVGVIVELRS